MRQNLELFLSNEIKWDKIILSGEDFILLTYDLYMRTEKGEIRCFRN